MNKSIRKVLNSPLFSGSAIMIVGSNSINVLSYLYHFVMGKLLGPASYGELVALISLIGLLGIIPVAVNLVIIKYISAAKNEKEIVGLTNWFKSRVLKFSLLFFCLITLFSPFIVSFLHINSILYVILIAISYLFSLSTIVNRAILQGLLKFKEMIFSMISENIIKLLLGAVLVFIGFGVGGAMIGFTVSLMVGWYVTQLYLKFSNVKKISSHPNVKSMIRYTFPVIVQTLAVTSIYSSDVILVKHFFSAHETGIYASLSTLSKIILFGTGPIGAVMFPLVSKRQSRGEDYKNVFYFSLLATLLCSSVVLLIYWLFPEIIIIALYNYTYLEAKDLLVWFGLFMTLFTLAALVINYSLSLGKTRVVILPSIAAVLQVLAIWFFHQTLFIVITISITVTALLLVALLIYYIYEKGKKIGDKINIINSSSI